jgi:RNA polymerase primary sigma factor
MKNITHHITKNGRYKQFTPELERKLIAKAQKGDHSARNQIILNHMFVAQAAADSYRSRNPTIPIDDMVQEAAIGMNRAIDKFDVAKKVRFSTYATWWAKAYVNKYILKASYTVRTKKGGITGLNYLSLNAPVRQAIWNEDWKKMSLQDTLIADQEPTDVSYERQELIHKMRQILQNTKLSEREVLILNQRLLQEDPKTLQQIGDQLGVCRESIRRNELDLINKLRRQLKSVG